MNKDDPSLAQFDNDKRVRVKYMQKLPDDPALPAELLQKGIETTTEGRAVGILIEPGEEGTRHLVLRLPIGVDVDVVKGTVDPANYVTQKIPLSRVVEVHYLGDP